MFTLGRKIDFNYKTNKMILIISAMAMAAGFIVTGDIKSSIYIGVGTFLTWALTREVDPKHEYSAFLAAAISLLNIIYYENINLLVIFLVLLVLRLLNGITGKEITLLDLSLVLLLSIITSLSTENSIYLVPFLSAVMTLSGLSKNPKKYYIFLFISAAVFLFESFYLNYFAFEFIGLSNRINLVIIALAVIFVIWINFIKIKGTLNDNGQPVDEKRVRAAQMLYGSIVILFFLGEVSLNNLIIYFAVMIGIIVYSFFDR